jgi:hypothetical protein
MPADGTFRRPLLICGSLGALRSQGGSRTAYAQHIEIEMRLALFFRSYAIALLLFLKQRSVAWFTAMQ